MAAQYLYWNIIAEFCNAATLMACAALSQPRESDDNDLDRSRGLARHRPVRLESGVPWQRRVSFLEDNLDVNHGAPFVVRFVVEAAIVVVAGPGDGAHDVASRHDIEAPRRPANHPASGPASRAPGRNGDRRPYRCPNGDSTTSTWSTHGYGASGGGVIQGHEQGCSR